MTYILCNITIWFSRKIHMHSIVQRFWVIYNSDCNDNQSCSSETFLHGIGN